MLASKQKKKSKILLVYFYIGGRPMNIKELTNHDWATMTQVFHDILLNLYQKSMYMDT